jgi:hypothetical protein
MRVKQNVYLLLEWNVTGPKMLFLNINILYQLLIKRVIKKEIKHKLIKDSS